MLAPWKRRLVRAAIIGGPFLLLFLAVRVGAPALERFKQWRLMGADYALHDIEGEAATYRVQVAGGTSQATLLAKTLDRFLVDAAAEGRVPFGLRVPERRVTLSIFRSKPELDDMARFRLHVDDFNYNGGYFNPVERSIALYEDPSQPGALMDGLRHEGAHLLFSHVARPDGLSPWLAEGLACYYEDEFAPDAADRLRKKARAALALGELPQVVSLLSAKHEAFSAKDNERAYRDAHLLVAYFFKAADAHLRNAFFDYVRDELFEGPRSPDTLARRLKMDAATLESAVQDWVARLAAL